MYNIKDVYSTPVKKIDLNCENHNEISASNHQEKRYRTHQHLHRNNYSYAINDTPSTLHTMKTVNCTNQYKQFEGKPLRPSLREGIVSQYARHSRNRSTILSIRELKQQKARMYSRAASGSSIKSSKRKLFVTISKTNNHLNNIKGVLGNSESLRDLDQNNKRIKLVKYLQLRSAQKTVPK